MRRAVFYEPDDFGVPASEQFLAIHYGEELSRESDFGSSFSTLLSKFQIETASDRTGLILPALAIADIHEWKDRAEQILSWPITQSPVEISFVRRAWVSKEKWNEIVLVGEGEGRWVLLHWYTTA